MVNGGNPRPGSCPTLESWCAYVDGSMAGGDREELGEHLSACDRCFSTVVSLREDMAAENDVESYRQRPLLRYVAAAVVAFAVLGALYLASSSEDMLALSTRGDLARESAGERQFGFAGESGDVMGASAGVRGLAVFAGTEGDPIECPSWALDLFDAERAGSVSQLLASRGVAAPPLDATVQIQRFRSDESGADTFIRDILRAVDEELNLARFDSDGPDGVADSGDDDGIVDYVIVVLSDRAVTRIGGVARATAGVEALTYLTQDASRSGRRMLVQLGTSGCVVAGTSFEQAVEAIVTEYATTLRPNP